MRAFFVQPVDDLVKGLERSLSAARRPWITLAMVLLALAATWWVYVPVHEMLHVLGCVITGGTVSELEVDPLYGGAVLSKVFPFVKPGGAYAGRLSGFDTRGSDLCYFVTVFMPFTLTILVGVTLMQCCRRRARPLVFGAATVLGLAPFCNLLGDYYEMGAIVTTGLPNVVRGGGGPVWESLRSDDLPALIGDWWLRPGTLDLAGPGERMLAGIVIAGSSIVGVALAFATYALGRGVSAATRAAIDRRHAEP